MNASSALLSWFDKLLDKENKARVFINCLIVLPCFCGLLFACSRYNLNYHKLFDLLESEEGMPVFAQLGAIIYVNLQENEILSRLREFNRFLQDESQRTGGRNRKLESRLEKALVHLIKHKLKEEVKYPDSKPE